VAPAWQSAHNYGLGVDLNVIDGSGHSIQPGWVDPTGQHRNWYSFYRDLARFISEGFEWGDRPSVGNPLAGDSGHFEYHPDWPGLIGVRNGISIDKIKAARDEAMREAASEGKYYLPTNPASTDWLLYLWNRAGTCPDVDGR
jgi:D-alanyl-D-alanine carboxypeptidase